MNVSEWRRACFEGAKGFRVRRAANSGHRVAEVVG